MGTRAANFSDRSDRQMYCPKCGIQNNEEMKFCRGCGEDLNLISQAMTRRLPAFLARKMDAYIENKNRRLRRQSIGGALGGGLFIFLGLYNAIGTGAPWANELFYIAFGCFMLLLGCWDYLVYKRSLSTDVKVIKMGGASTTNELPPINKARIVEPPASVTESTTRLLEANRDKTRG